MLCGEKLKGAVYDSFLCQECIIVKDWIGRCILHRRGQSLPSELPIPASANANSTTSSLLLMACSTLTSYAHLLPIDAETCSNPGKRCHWRQDHSGEIGIVSPTQAILNKPGRHKNAATKTRYRHNSLASGLSLATSAIPCCSARQ